MSDKRRGPFKKYDMLRGVASGNLYMAVNDSRGKHKEFTEVLVLEMRRPLSFRLFEVVRLSNTFLVKTDE